MAGKRTRSQIEEEEVAVAMGSEQLGEPTSKVSNAPIKWYSWKTLATAFLMCNHSRAGARSPMKGLPGKLVMDIIMKATPKPVECTTKADSIHYDIFYLTQNISSAISTAKFDKLCPVYEVKDLKNGGRCSNTVMMAAVLKENLGLIEHLAAKEPALLYLANDSLETPMALAASRGYLGGLSAMVRYGGNPNSVCWGSSLLDLAIFRGDKKMADYLISVGAVVALAENMLN